MNRPPTIDDLKKRIKYRKYIWLIGMIFLLLLDEYVKEGYLFDVSDVFMYGTHEFLITLIALLIGALIVNDLTENKD